MSKFVPCKRGLVLLIESVITGGMDGGSMTLKVETLFHSSSKENKISD